MVQHGAGGFADVFCGSADGVVVALKRLRVYLMSTETKKTEMKRAFYRESLLWKNLVHKHILPFLGVSEDVFPKTICMVLPWMDNGSIRHYIDTLQRQGKLAGADFSEAVDSWLYEVGLGIEYLHGEGIVHGDLHGGNILVDADGSIRLTDFGMSLISEASAYNYASMHGGGATRWQAPELLDPEEFGFTSSRPTYFSDIYSFGCTCIELYTGAAPFADLSDRQIVSRVLKSIRPSRPSFHDGRTMSDEIWSLMTSCWTEKPSERLVAASVVQSLAEIRFSSKPGPIGVTETVENSKVTTALVEAAPLLRVTPQDTSTYLTESEMQIVAPGTTPAEAKTSSSSKATAFHQVVTAEPDAQEKHVLMQVLEKMDSCSRGNAWIDQPDSNGSRCEGGSHFKSYTEVKERARSYRAGDRAIAQKSWMPSKLETPPAAQAKPDAQEKVALMYMLGNIASYVWRDSPEENGFRCEGPAYFVSYEQARAEFRRQ